MWKVDVWVLGCLTGSIPPSAGFGAELWQRLVGNVRTLAIMLVPHPSLMTRNSSNPKPAWKGGRTLSSAMAEAHGQQAKNKTDCRRQMWGSCQVRKLHADSHSKPIIWRVPTCAITWCLARTDSSSRRVACVWVDQLCG